VALHRFQDAGCLVRLHHTCNDTRFLTIQNVRSMCHRGFDASHSAGGRPCSPLIPPVAEWGLPLPLSSGYQKHFRLLATIDKLGSNTHPSTLCSG
jgi:hypothetical protein